MAEVELDGVRYRINKMSVFDQAHVARTVAPIIFSMGRGYSNALAKLPTRPRAGDGNGEAEDVAPEPIDMAQQNEVMFETMGPIADVLSKMSDEDVNYVIKKCLGVCAKHTGQSWAPLIRGGNLMFEDLDLATLMQLTMEVVQDNLGPSLRGLLGQASAEEVPSQSIM